VSICISNSQKFSDALSKTVCISFEAKYKKVCIMHMMYRMNLFFVVHMCDKQPPSIGLLPLEHC